MKIRKFTAPSVPMALRQVHDDLGDRAVILNTRTLPDGGDPQGRVEVTAALDEEATVAVGATGGVSAGATVGVSGATMGTSPRATREARPDLLGRVYGRSRPGAEAMPAEVPTSAEQRPRWNQPKGTPQVEERHIRSAADWLASLPTIQREQAEAPSPDVAQPHPVAEPKAPAARVTVAESPGESAVIGQLRQLEEAVHHMASQAGGFALPQELSRLSERLRRTGLTEAHVHSCLQSVMRELNNDELDDQKTVARAAMGALTKLLPAASDIRIGRQCRVVGLVGPSGSGKTTAAARIAAGFVRRRQQRGAPSDGSEIVLISTDSRRVGALAQARAFANLIRVPLETAYDEQEITRAVDTHKAARLVLVDVGGCGPHERSEMEEQKRMLSAAGVDEVHIVVDGLTGLDHILEAARAWKEPVSQTTCLMVTKMDQSVRPGTVVSAAIEAQLPISYLTTSAAVPGGIRPGNLAPWIEWMVGLAPRPFTDANG
jgi:flagellar biosynthesis protein FlhF